MGAWVDRLGVVLVDATLAATVLLILVSLAMVGCRQPARRCGLARGAIVACLVLIPLVGLGPAPRIQVVQSLVQLSPPMDLQSSTAPVVAQVLAVRPIALRWLVTAYGVGVAM